MKKLLVFLGAILMVLFAFGTSNAAFLQGNQIFAEYLYPDTSTQLKSYGTFTVVDPGVEISDVWPGPITVNTDLSDTNITWTFSTGGSFAPLSSSDVVTFDGYHFQDTLSNIAGIASVTINGATNMTGFDASRISFDANNVFVNFQDLGFGASTVVSLDLTPVPIPSAIYLFGTGLVGLVGFGRKRLRR